jgi:hypothetical protein
MQGSIKNTFDLFYGLRKMGIPAHFWPWKRTRTTTIICIGSSLNAEDSF